MEGWACLVRGIVAGFGGLGSSRRIKFFGMGDSTSSVKECYSRKICRILRVFTATNMQEVLHSNEHCKFHLCDAFYN